MKNAALNLSLRAQKLLAGEEGQDLVEYVLLAGIVALAAVAAVGPIALAVTSMFSNISASV